ncbi:MAG: hypothetical protein WCI94_22635 [Rhodospirillales bacterium]
MNRGFNIRYDDRCQQTRLPRCVRRRRRREVQGRNIDRAPGWLGIDVAYIPSQGELTKLLSAEIDFALVDIPVADDKFAVGNRYRFPVAFGALAIATYAVLARRPKNRDRSAAAAMKLLTWR